MTGAMWQCEVKCGMLDIVWYDVVLYVRCSVVWYVQCGMVGAMWKCAMWYGWCNVVC